MMDMVWDNVKGIRAVLGSRIGQFVRQELTEFQADPRWLLQGECPYTSAMQGDPREMAKAIMTKDYSEEIAMTNNSQARSGRSHGSFSSGGGCCPPVVDQYTWLALISGIALATYFLRIAVTTNIMGRRRKREGVHNLLLQGQSVKHV